MFKYFLAVLSTRSSVGDSLTLAQSLRNSFLVVVLTKAQTAYRTGYPTSSKYRTLSKIPLPLSFSKDTPFGNPISTLQ